MEEYYFQNCRQLKVTLLLLRFLNCANDTELHEVSHFLEISKLISLEIIKRCAAFRISI